MDSLYNFPSDLVFYLGKRKISLDFFANLLELGLIKVKEKSFLIAMKNIEGEIVGWQERFYDPIIYQGKVLKTKCVAGSSSGYFFTDIDFTDKIIIFEGEIDFLIMQGQKNILGVQGVAQTRGLVQQLLQKGVQEIYLCIDNDIAGDVSLGTLLSMEKSHLFCICDSRSLFAGHKDIGEYVLKTDITPTVEDIQKHGKNLAEYKTSIESFLCEGKNGGISLDHFELAKRIISKYEIATVKGNIFMYKGGIRKLTDKYALEQIILQEIELFTKAYNKKILSSDKNSTYDFILSLGLNENLEKQLMRTGDYNIPLNDGVYNAQTKELIPYRKDMYLFQKFDYDYKDLQDAPVPVLFIKTLDSILEGYSENVANFLQEFIGAMFVSFTWGKALMLTGSGGNGKGILADITAHIIGSERVLHAGLQEISTNPQMVYNLIDKYALIDTDMGQGHQLDNSLNKKLISAEPISGKQLYHNPITFRGKIKVWCNCNEMPYLKSIDNSVLRRWYILSLNNVFIGKEDFMLGEKLKEERIAIRKRAMQGLERLISRGFFLPPQEIKEQLDSFIHDNDTVALFLDEGSIEEAENEKIYNKDLYLAYKFFCSNGGYKALSQRSFSKRLKDKKFIPFRDGAGRGFLGLRENRPF